jgi:hypothetical protein
MTTEDNQQKLPEPINPEIPTELGNEQIRAETEPKGSDFDFDRMDKDVEEFREKIKSINPDINSDQPDEFNDFSAGYTPLRRRRRAIRSNDSTQQRDIGDQLSSILERSTPNLDFFLLSILCGLIIGIGYAIDSNAILMFGIFVSPFLGPWVGALLSSTIGELRYFKQTIGGFFTSILMTLITSVLVGGVSRFFASNNHIHAYYHSHLWWPDILLMVVGTIILILRFVQSDVRPIIPSLMVSYAFYLPVSVAGFGLGAGIDGLWPAGLFVFFVHLAISLLISLVMFFYLGVRPNSVNGFAITGGLILVSVIILVLFGGFGGKIQGNTSANVAAVLPETATAIVPSETPFATKTTAPIASNTPMIATFTATAVPPTLTPINTGVPASVIGKIMSMESNGVVVRISPGGVAVTTVLNNYPVRILSDPPVIDENGEWVHVIIIDQLKEIEGWILSKYIITATPDFAP